MSEVKILRVQVHSPLSILTQVRDHRRIAKVVHVVGAALVVKQNVPVSPARGARVEITHDIVTVALALAPSTVRDPGGLSLIVRQHGQLEARLRRQQERVRVRFGHVGHVIEAAPRVPMEGDPVHVLRRRAVSAEQSVRPLLDVVLVVVVPKDFDVGVGLFESRTEMFGDEIAGLLRSVDARLPRLLRLRFVLHGHAPHGHALSLVGRDPLGEILGKGIGDSENTQYWSDVGVLLKGGLDGGECVEMINTYPIGSAEGLVLACEGSVVLLGATRKPGSSRRLSVFQLPGPTTPWPRPAATLPTTCRCCPSSRLGETTASRTV
mmetsp:Transcript_24246/g.65559  ORF Transcript_24246/g.65559 Transcript_24246/m.65559 type:complete len:322 (+) Transcript_24246:449-1414(+)